MSSTTFAKEWKKKSTTQQNKSPVLRRQPYSTNQNIQSPEIYDLLLELEKMEEDLVQQAKEYENKVFELCGKINQVSRQNQSLFKETIQLNGLAKKINKEAKELLGQRLDVRCAKSPQLKLMKCHSSGSLIPGGENKSKKKSIFSNYQV